MVRRTLVVAVVALSLLGGCSSGAASTVSGAARGPAPPTGSANALDLRDAPVSALVGQLADAVGMPVTVDADAVPLTRCARVTFVAPAGTPRAQLVALATDVLRSAALSLTNAGDHLTVERIADAEVPEDCQGMVGRLTTGGTPDPALDPSLVEPSASEPTLAGIRLLSENTYEIDPDSPTFEGGEEMWMRSARIVPHVGADGTTDGLQLFGIRRSSVMGALGFQNGDTVLRVNGRPMSSPEAALDVTTLARTAERLEAEIERRGQPITMTYLRRAVTPRVPGAPR